MGVVSTAEVREQVYVAAPLADAIGLLSVRRRAWLRVVARLAAGEAEPGSTDDAVDRLVLGAARVGEPAEQEVISRVRNILERRQT